MTRWNTVWVFLCIIAAFVVDAGDSGNKDTIVLGIIAAAIVGGFALGRWQHHVETRPCPRCGNRVANGSVECECGFDFRSIGKVR